MVNYLLAKLIYYEIIFKVCIIRGLKDKYILPCILDLLKFFLIFSINKVFKFLFNLCFNRLKLLFLYNIKSKKNATNN